MWMSVQNPSARTRFRQTCDLVAAFRTGRDRFRSTLLTEGLSNIAIDSNFAGIGTIESKRNQYERWDDGVEPAKFVAPDSDLLRLIQDCIARLKTALDAESDVMPLM